MQVHKCPYAHILLLWKVDCKFRLTDTPWLILKLFEWVFFNMTELAHIIQGLITKQNDIKITIILLWHSFENNTQSIMVFKSPLTSILWSLFQRHFYWFHKSLLMFLQHKKHWTFPVNIYLESVLITASSTCYLYPLFLFHCGIHSN